MVALDDITKKKETSKHYCPFQSKRQLPCVIWRLRLNGQILEGNHTVDSKNAMPTKFIFSTFKLFFFIIYNLT